MLSTLLSLSWRSGRRARQLAFLGLSVLLHAAVTLVLAALTWQPWMPRLEVTWLDLDNRLGAPQPAPARPAPTPPRPAPPSRPSRAEEEAQKHKQEPRRTAAVKPAPRDAGVPARDAGVLADSMPGDAAGSGTGPALASLAPGDAALVLALRMDRIRSSPYAEAVRRLLEVFYDYRTLLWSSGLEPTRDFDALLIATPNPYRVTETFLVARHSLPRWRIRDALERATHVGHNRLRWTRAGTTEHGDIPSPPKLPQDPRIVLLRDNLLVLTDPKHEPLLSSLSSSPRSDGGPRGDGAARQDWSSSLAQLGITGGAQQQGPGLLLLAMNLPRLVRLPQDVPTPLAFEVSIEAVAPTEAKGQLGFATPDEAKRFMQVIPARIEDARRSLMLRLLGVSELLSGLRLRREEERVHATLPLSAVQVQSVLELLRGMIPPIHVPGMPPRLAPDAGVAAPNTRPRDAGRATERSR